MNTEPQDAVSIIECDMKVGFVLLHDVITNIQWWCVVEFRTAPCNGCRAMVNDLESNQTPSPQKEVFNGCGSKKGAEFYGAIASNNRHNNRHNNILTIHPYPDHPSPSIIAFQDLNVAHHRWYRHW